MRILIVEDSDLVHAALVEVLGDCPDADVIGRAIGEAEAIAAILEAAPDVVLLDLALSPGSGLEVLRTIRARGCAARVLVVSNQAGDVMRRHCLEAGADGFFDKCTELGMLLAHLAAGGPPVPPACPATGAVAPVQDTGARVLEAIVARASALTGCPMAAISLLDASRQWFLAQAGLGLAGTSRHVAFCAHTLAEGGLLEVTDAVRDPRFRCNPLTAAPFGVRYYAGVPLVLSSGCAVGTLCVLDTDPRALAPGQREGLRRLADEAAAQLERIRPDASAACTTCSTPPGATATRDAPTGATTGAARAMATPPVDPLLPTPAPRHPAGQATTR